MKIWLISDPHHKHGFLDIVEDVDMVICAGDVAIHKQPIMNESGVLDFIEWYKSLVHIPYKIWIAGNHDTSIAAGLVKPKALPPKMKPKKIAPKKPFNTIPDAWEDDGMKKGGRVKRK